MFFFPEIIPYFEHSLTHFKQRFDWDCGLSSILMILDEPKRKHFLERFQEICDDGNFGKSTWTIDLCYILKRFEIKHKYMTATIGINPDYNKYSHYNRILEKDEIRILTKFEKAAENGISIQKRSLSNEFLMRHLSNWGPIILLTNASLLTCDICKTNKLSTEFRSCFPFKSGYSGHYIVLTGYNFKVRKFFYRNPANKDRVCVMSYDRMTEARIDNGTDEDVILIYNEKQII